MTDKFFDTDGAAKELGGLSPKTLEKWRITGKGPAFRKFGKRVLYADADLHAWADAQRRSSTSEGH